MGMHGANGLRAVQRTKAIGNLIALIFFALVTIAGLAAVIFLPAY